MHAQRSPKMTLSPLIRPRALATGAAVATALLALGGCGSSTPSANGGSPPSAAGSPSSSMSGMPSMSSMPSMSASTGQSSGGGSGTAAGRTMITIKDFAYSGGQGVPAGATVTVKNDDSVAHTVTADDGSGGSFDVNIDPGATATFKAPSKPGSYPYHCTYHSNMHGVLKVS